MYGCGGLFAKIESFLFSKLNVSGRATRTSASRPLPPALYLIVLSHSMQGKIGHHPILSKKLQIRDPM
jgi:hypothetical protein